MVHLILKDAGLDYPMYGPASLSLRAQILRPAIIGAKINANEHSIVTTCALESVNLELKEGDRLGLVGSNGSGKSTLLKLMAGVYSPTRGTVLSEGEIRTLFNIGLGMDDEATGFENVVLMGLAHGASRKEIDQKIDEIVEFSELGQYMSFPMRTYSDGMRLRLSFAVATAFGADIVLIDEIFGVGDQRFYQKASMRLNQYIGETGIVVLASHSAELVRQICTKALWVDQGVVKALGPVDDVLTAYMG